ncbi:MAG: hypothetical protein V4623_02785 [Pseudomonadota bacterium]
MRTTLRFFLMLIALPAGMLSLASLFFWGIVSYGFFSGQTPIEFARQYAPDLLANADPYKIALFQIKDYFVVIGGAYGWVALFRLCALANRAFREIPKWVMVGCVVGIATALVLSFPSWNPLACPPILLTIALLFRSYLARPPQSA